VRRGSPRLALLPSFAPCILRHRSMVAEDGKKWRGPVDELLPDLVVLQSGFCLILLVLHLFRICARLVKLSRETC
jgi:hypothetical protein